MLANQGLGLFHSFTVLEVVGKHNDKHYICVEKFNDALELMVGEGSRLFLMYAQLFRATGEERPVSQKRPIAPQGKMSLQAGVTVKDLYDWIAGPLAMIWQPYSLLG